MNPEGNRHHEHYPNGVRPADPRYPPGYPILPQSSMPNLYSYILPMMYPPYPYPGFSMPNMPNNGYFSGLGHWRDSMVSVPNVGADMNSLRNYYNPQNMRVVLRQPHEKAQSNVINLQSDDEDSKQKNVLVPPNNNIAKQAQKQTKIINLDDFSDDKNQKQPSQKPSELINVFTQTLKSQNPKEQLSILRDYEKKLKAEKKLAIPIPEDELRQFKKLAREETQKTKPIAKPEKSVKERPKKTLQLDKVIMKVEKEKEQQKSDKKKLEKIEKSEKQERAEKHQKPEKLFEKQEKLQKYERQQKPRKSVLSQDKIKQEQLHTKQIAKYMESHGEIRHGKEFQSDIPPVKISSNIQFNRWLESKRNQLLRREVGTLTY